MNTDESYKIFQIFYNLEILKNDEREKKRNIPLSPTFLTSPEIKPLYIKDFFQGCFLIHLQRCAM